MLEIFVVPTLVATLVLVISLIGWWLAIEWAFRPYNPKKQLADTPQSTKGNAAHSASDTKIETSQHQSFGVTQKLNSKNVVARGAQAIIADSLHRDLPNAQSIETDSETISKGQTTTAADNALQRTANKMAKPPGANNNHNAAAWPNSRTSQHSPKHIANQPKKNQHSTDQTANKKPLTNGATENSALQQNHAESGSKNSNANTGNKTQAGQAGQAGLGNTQTSANQNDGKQARHTGSNGTLGDTQKSNDQANKVEAKNKKAAITEQPLLNQKYGGQVRAVRKETRQVSSRESENHKHLKSAAKVHAPEPELVAEHESSAGPQAYSSSLPAKSPSTSVTGATKQQQPKYQTAAKAKSPSVKNEASIQISDPTIRPTESIGQPSDNLKPAKTDQHYDADPKVKNKQYTEEQHLEKNLDERNLEAKTQKETSQLEKNQYTNNKQALAGSGTATQKIDSAQQKNTPSVNAANVEGSLTNTDASLQAKAPEFIDSAVQPATDTDQQPNNVTSKAPNQSSDIRHKVEDQNKTKDPRQEQLQQTLDANSTATKTNISNTLPPIDASKQSKASNVRSIDSAPNHHSPTKVGSQSRQGTIGGTKQSAIEIAMQQKGESAASATQAQTQKPDNSKVQSTSTQKNSKQSGSALDTSSNSSSTQHPSDQSASEKQTAAHDASIQKASDQKDTDREPSAQDTSALRSMDQDLSTQNTSSQNATGLNPSDQNSLNQKATGLNPSDQNSPNQKATGQDPSDQNSPNLKATGQNPSDQSPSNQNATGQDPSDQNSPNLKATGQNPAEQSSSTQKATGLNPSNQNSPNQNATGLNPSDQNSPNQKATGLNPAEQSSSTQKATGLNPSDQGSSTQKVTGRDPSAQNASAQNTQTQNPATEQTPANNSVAASPAAATTTKLTSQLVTAEANTQSADTALRTELELSKRRIASLQSTLNKAQHNPQISTESFTGQSTQHTRPTLLSKVRVLDSESV